jgi:hypothetical protein
MAPRTGGAADWRKRGIRPASEGRRASWSAQPGPGVRGKLRREQRSRLYKLSSVVPGGLLVASIG